jgi:ABC-type multidrug transport system fused ATPase/permease subunit
MMSVMRVEELTDLESDEVKGPLLDSEGIHRDHREVMPKELSGAGDALVELYAQDANHPPEITMASVSDASLVQSGWPWKGDVLFKEVSMRYNPISPLVLKNITISVPRGSSLGVVGRTGSGKSSLLLTLFRLVEIEYGGCIEIDGVDIRSISLKTLRESLSIIPQDPVLFAGTLMYNLDATGNAKPEDAWAALEAASPELALQFRKTVTGLDSYISEGGKNLSAGQRQLICLARALLRRSKILVMDEATSSVDGNTDAQVQETIRREFVDKGVTVLTVAHRLDTVLGYDKIAVLGDGKLLEYGSPSELLAIRNGELRRLVEADRRNKRKGGSAKATQPAVVV